MTRKLAILSYHKIGEPAPGGWDTWYYISEKIFSDQIRCLRDHGYEIIDVQALYRGLDDPASLPPRSAMLTFDDAYRDIRTVALPVMRQFGVPGVVFVPTNYIGGLNAFDAGNEPEEPICDWEDLLALEEGGVAVESHSMTHPAFSTLTSEQHAEELRASKEVLESRLGRKVELFAYPYGDAGVDPKLSEEALRTAGYRAACLYGGGPVILPGADRFRLERLAMGPDSDLRQLLSEE